MTNRKRGTIQEETKLKTLVEGNFVAILIREVSVMKVKIAKLDKAETDYTIEKDIAATKLLLRDLKLEDWGNLKADQYSLRASTRFGLGILRSNAVAKMINIKHQDSR